MHTVSAIERTSTARPETRTEEDEGPKTAGRYLDESHCTFSHRCSAIEDRSLTGPTQQTILALTLTLFLTSPLLYIFVILFGAPFTTHHAHTFLLALHLALLTTPHLFYIHSLDGAKWMKIVSLQLPVDETYGLSLGAWVGAWLGAIPIPLDWDREWQKWPVTVVVGMWFGAAVGKVVGGYLCKGMRMKMT